MQEYITQALILHKQASQETDALLTLYAEELGRCVVKARGMRRMLSKLSPHTEPGMLSTVRIVEQHGLTLVDALQIKKLFTNTNTLYLLSELLHGELPDPELWASLMEEPVTWLHVLRALGWDPEHAHCASCMGKPDMFLLDSQTFSCASCIPRSQIPKDKVVYIHERME